MKTRKRTSREAVIFADGAASGNPGPAGIGVVVIIDGRKLSLSEPIGEATNNVAEYTALLRGLETAAEHNVKRVKVCLDSELVVRQLNGIYRVRSAGLIPLYRKVSDLLSRFEDYTITHVRRSENSEADTLAKRAVQGNQA
ncbi:MAG: ribonuclease HI family protein [Nitrospirae bacterium]|nr:ribonuclease HI family protein [Nitrospirota bacterium]